MLHLPARLSPSAHSGRRGSTLPRPIQVLSEGGRCLRGVPHSLARQVSQGCANHGDELPRVRVVEWSQRQERWGRCSGLAQGKAQDRGWCAWSGIDEKDEACWPGRCREPERGWMPREARPAVRATEASAAPRTPS